MTNNNYIATCKFGLEGVLAHELRDLGAKDVAAKNARVFFNGDYDILAKACISLRTAERIYLVVGSFLAKSFEELFEGVKALDWENYILKNSKFPVNGKSVRSQLHSVSDCQAITKKAIVEKLKSKYNVSWFEETGPECIIDVSLLDDIATICIDASGAGLARRGYRTLNAQAPLSETISAGLILLNKKNFIQTKNFWDPMCGSGTIAIEAAMIAHNIAPGISRSFSAQQWSFINKKIWTQQKQQAQEAIKVDKDFVIRASDIDSGVLELAKIHAKQAGVDIQIQLQDATEISLLNEQQKGMIVCNPPYGIRLLEKNSAQQLYVDMGKSFLNENGGWFVGLLSAHSEVERFFGKRADKRRKIYNSDIICHYYQYFDNFKKAKKLKNK